MAHEWGAILIFGLVVSAILIRPRKIRESVFALIGAVLVLVFGYVTPADVQNVFSIVSGAAIITLSTIVMSSILDRAGFFRWAARRIALKAQGSGLKLFIYALLLSFFMTLFFNNDGSILITTPILVSLTNEIGLSKQQAIPILLGSALIATSSSAPIGVSNIANLIALRIVGLNLNMYAVLMFLPSMFGIMTCGLLLYFVFRKSLKFNYLLEPRRKPKLTFPPLPDSHRLLPHEHKGHISPSPPAIDTVLFKVGIFIVIVVRCGFFVATSFNIPPEYVALAGATFLFIFYFVRNPGKSATILRDIPWHIIVFAISMYVVVYSLKNIGLTSFLGNILTSISGQSPFGLIFATGISFTVLSCITNNLPAVMIGTLTLTGLHLPVATLQLSYLANILGSDIGSLLLPIGTLASLLWFHIVTRSVRISWFEYIKVSFIVIPPSLLVALFSLWLWGGLILR
jgi:arsenical pump membrane protein